jgi:hypothetical protein
MKWFEPIESHGFHTRTVKLDFKRIKSESFLTGDKSRFNEQVLIGRIQHFESEIVPRMNLDLKGLLFSK